MERIMHNDFNREDKYRTRSGKDYFFSSIAGALVAVGDKYGTLPLTLKIIHCIGTEIDLHTPNNCGYGN